MLNRVKFPGTSILGADGDRKWAMDRTVPTVARSRERVMLMLAGLQFDVLPCPVSSMPLGIITIKILYYGTV